MPPNPPRFLALIPALAALALAGAAFASTPPSNSGFVDAEGRTHVSRIVPVPTTVSPEAQTMLGKPPPVSFLSSGLPVAEQRARIAARQAKDAAECQRVYPAAVAEAILAGVPVHIVSPLRPARADCVLLNLHGGGFTTDAGSLLETIPIASLARIKVVAVLYRLAPEHPFPAAADDAIAVYRELLKTYTPPHIAIYGTSAGAVLTAEVAVKLKRLGLPLPAALGIFSGSGDFSRTGDSFALFGINGLAGSTFPQSAGKPSAYAGMTDLSDPELSPVYADLRGLPPTLFITSTRDMLLSGTTILHRAFLDAGVDAQLVVYEALPHAFWLNFRLPESQSANERMARFLSSRF